MLSQDDKTERRETHVFWSFGTIISWKAGRVSIAELLCRPAGVFAAITRSSSLLLLCDDRSAFCHVWRVPPCLFGSAMFPPLSSAPPDSQSAGKLSFFQPLECQEKTRRFCTLERAWAGWGGVGSRDLVFCLLRLQMGKDHAPFLISAQAAAVISYLSPPTMKTTDACTRPRTPLILGLRQPQVLRIAAFRCF